MAAVSAPSFGKLIDVYANQGLPFLPGPFWGGHFLTRLGKSDDSPLDQIDAIFKKVILIPKSNHLPPLFYRITPYYCGGSKRSLIGSTIRLPI